MQCTQGVRLLFDVGKGDCYLSDVADDSHQITKIEIKVNTKSPISPPRVISSTEATSDLGQAYILSSVSLFNYQPG